MNDSNQVNPEQNNVRRNKVIIGFTFFLVILAIAWLILYLLYFQFYESTDDAYANGCQIDINPVISGYVAAFYADDTDLVKEGQLLVRLDPTPFQIAYEKEISNLAATVLQVKQIYDNVDVSRFNAENKKVALSKAQFDYNNRQKLVGVQAVSNEDFIHSGDTLTTAFNEVKIAEYQLRVAQDARGVTDMEHHPMIEQSKGNVRQAYYYLKHCDILAPVTGYIAKRSVDAGQWVTPTTAMMALIPQNYVWVDANFKETQLAYMRIGQTATVWLDIYGSGIKYQGKVLGISAGSGSAFSLIPPQNATGNWIKIVQRLPVRISLDAETLSHYPTRIGLTANVDVDITDQNLPMLAQFPTERPLQSTTVFDIELGKINAIIDEVIQKTIK